MKTIITAPEAQQFINLESVNNDSIVGIEFKESGEKAFVIRNEDGVFVCASSGDTNLSVRDNDYWTERTMRDCIKRASRQSDTVPYLFNTLKELCAWIAE